MSLCFQPEELRAIITGKRSYKRCPDCQGTGIVWGDADGNALSATDAVERGEDVCSEPCQDCDEVGYIVAVYEDEE